MPRIPYNLEINNSRDHNMLCELLAKARKDYEEEKEDIIIGLLHGMSQRIDDLSSEVARLTNLIQSDDLSVKASEEHYPDDLYRVANINSPITYTISMCSEMQRAYIEHVLWESKIPSSVRYKIQGKYNSLRTLITTSASDFAKIEGVSKKSAVKLRSYIAEKFHYPQQKNLFSLELVHDMKQIYIDYILCSIGIYACIGHYSTLDDLSTTTRTELMQIHNIGPAKVDKLCKHLKAEYYIDIRD